MKTIIQKAVYIVILFLTMVSCLDLTEINEDPNNPTKAPSNYILTYVLSKTAVNYKALGNYNSQVSGAMQYVQVGTNESAWYMNHYDWNKGSWSSYYDILRNIEIMNKYAVEDNNPVFEALSLILKSFVYGFTTDIFGDIPYSESLKAAEEVYFPRYDEQKYIYKGILEDLNKAESLLAGSNISNYKITSSSDLLFGGDVSKWRKFANSLRLRYSMRLYEKRNEMKTLEIDILAIFNDAVTKAFKSNDDDAVIKYIGTTKENSHPGGKLNSSNPPFATKPCKTIVDKLKLLNDPRLYRWVMPVQFKWDYEVSQPTEKTVVNIFNDSYTVLYMPTTNQSVDTSLYVGMPMGLAVQDAMNYNRGDYNETYHSERSPFISFLHQRYRENNDTFLKMELMSYSEVEFIISEAALKEGFIVNETAESHYKKGIEASMKRWGITNFNFDSYYNVPAVDFAKATDKLERILEQKWLAGWFTVEPWFDWRRTGYPNFQTGPVTSFGDALPIRMEYPTPNSDAKYMVNYNEAVERLESTIYVPTGQSKDHSYSKIWVIQNTGKPY